MITFLDSRKLLPIIWVRDVSWVGQKLAELSKQAHENRKPLLKPFSTIYLGLSEARTYYTYEDSKDALSLL